jgi:hypothetical protein
MSGTPTQAGTFSFTIQAADSFNTATQQFDLVIAPAAKAKPSGNGSDGCAARADKRINRALALAALVALLGVGFLGRRGSRRRRHSSDAAVR